MIRFVFLRSSPCLPLREQMPLAGLEAGASEEVGQCLGERVGKAPIRKAAVGRRKGDRFDIFRKQNGQGLAMNQM